MLIRESCRIYFGVEICQFEWWQIMFSGQVFDDLYVHVDSTVRATVSCAANEHRHALLTSCKQHELEIVFLPLIHADRAICTERGRADIVTAGICAVVIGLGRCR